VCQRQQRRVPNKKHINTYWIHYILHKDTHSKDTVDLLIDVTQSIMEFTLSSSSPSVLLFGCNRSLIMKTHQKKQNLIWTTVIAILLMMVLIDNMPIVNSLASSTSNSLLCMSNLVVTQQQYRVNNNNNNNNNMQRQRRSLTPLSSLSYYATIGSTNSISDEIPPSREILDVSETEEEPMIYSATTSTNILINTWNKIKSSMKFDKKAILGLGFDFGLTYNFISNINGSITLSVAWYIASIKVRKYITIQVYSLSPYNLFGLFYFVC
jgi:hypothetical protein